MQSHLLKNSNNSMETKGNRWASRFDSESLDFSPEESIIQSDVISDEINKNTNYEDDDDDDYDSEEVSSRIILFSITSLRKMLCFRSLLSPKGF